MPRVAKQLFVVVILIMTLLPGIALVSRNIPIDELVQFGSPNLFGRAVSADRPGLSLRNILSGKAQTDVALWLTERMGWPRAFYMRLSNSIDLLLGRSSNPQVIVGRNKELYTLEMLMDLCVPARTDFVTEMAEGLKRAQNSLAAQRKAFVFVMSPNKSAIQSENVPAYCKKRADERSYARLAEALKHFQVNYIDTEKLAEQSTADGLPAWFGKYGQHWNDIGQFYVTRAIIDNLREQTKANLGELLIGKVTLDDRPVGDEADTGLLSNFLLHLHPPSAHATFSLAGNRSSLRLLVIGTSFSDRIVSALVNSGLSQDLTLYNYFKWIIRYQTPSPQGPTLGAPEEYGGTLASVDAVIVEANASALNAPHIFSFIKTNDQLQQSR